MAKKDEDPVPASGPVRFEGGGGSSGVEAVTVVAPDAPENPTLVVDKSIDKNGGGAKSRLNAILGGNEYFAAGFGLMGLGIGLAYLRQITTRGSHWLYRRMLVDLEIPSKDKSYNWLLEWMAKNGPHQRQLHQQQQQLYQRQLESMGGGGGSSSQQVSMKPTPQEEDEPSGLTKVFSGMFNRVHHLSVNTIYKQHDNGSATATFNLVPGPGTHWMLYNGAIVRFSRERSGRLMDLTNGSPFETIKLTTLYRDRHVFGELLDEARSLAVTMQQGKTVMYTSWGPEWRPFGMPRRKRVLSSVVLDEGIKEAILEDVEDFLSSGNWYHDRGIPYRRGYLLYGPPGSGKSSFIQALAGYLDYNICILNLSEANLTDDRLNHLMNHIPERSILLLEDIDAAFNARKQSEEKGFQSGVTFSGLLNSLDGVASSEERIIFMTTNHRDRLDPALIRPGRVDAQWLIDWASPYQIERMFDRFYGKEAQESHHQIAQHIGKQVGPHKVTAKEFTNAVLALETHVSTAQLQGLFVFNKNRPDKALEMVPLLKQR